MAIRASKQLASRQLDWTLSTAALFEHFANDSWAILLDSANAPHQDARFDIICANPIATLVTQGERSDIKLIDTSLSLPEAIDPNRDPFELLNTLLTHWYSKSFDCVLPFSGGAMGSFSYDLGRRIESLPITAKQDIQLPEMNIGFYDWALVFDYQAQCWHLLHYLGEAALDIELNRIQDKITKKPNSATFVLTSPWTAQIDKAQYTAKFAAVQAYLHSGDCYQINLTQRFEAHYQGDEWSAYSQLRNTIKHPSRPLCVCRKTRFYRFHPSALFSFAVTIFKPNLSKAHCRVIPIPHRM